MCKVFSNPLVKGKLIVSAVLFGNNISYCITGSTRVGAFYQILPQLDHNTTLTLIKHWRKLTI